MEIRFLGPLNQVTGSCYWVRDTRRKLSFLVDCGMAQGENVPSYASAFPFDPSTIDFVLLTHAHQDHCGMLPKLFEHGFKGPVYCTAETETLTRISLSRSGENPSGLTFSRIGDGRIRQRQHLWDGVGVTAHPSGHIIGAVSYRLNWMSSFGQRSLVFSGDIGAMPGRRSFTLTRPPEPPPASDYVVMESTYGARRRETGALHLTALMGDLAALIDRARDQRGVLLIPTFSIERTQMIQLVLDELYRCDPGVKSVPLFVHSPTADAMGSAYANAWSGEWLDRVAAAQVGVGGVPAGRLRRLYVGAARRFDVDDGVPVAQQVVNRPAPVLGEESGPAVVLVSGGMLDAGTVRHYLPELLRRESTIIALAGYVSGDTTGGWIASIADARRNGRTISNEAFSGPAYSQLTLEAVDVKAKVARLDGYSGHGDQGDLVAWISGGGFRATRKIFLTHGDFKAREALRGVLEARRDVPRLRIERPMSDESWFDLDQGVWIGEPRGRGKQRGHANVSR